MKKLLLMTFALLTLGSAAAMAQDGTFNFAWNACRVAATTGTANDGTGACDGTDAARFLTPTFQPTDLTVTFGGTTVEFTVSFGTGVAVPDAWNVTGLGCNAGGLANQNVLTLANCANPFAGSTQSGGTFLSDVVGAEVKYGADWGRVSVPNLVLSTLPAGAGGYTAQRVQFSADAAGACAGCTEPACLTLTKVIWGSQTSGLRNATAPQIRGFVTWFGGPASCPGGTPTKSATWGQVKALYR